MAGFLSHLYRDERYIFDLEPIRDIEVEPDGYRLSGKSPTFRLSTSQGRMPQQWCLVYLDAERSLAALSPTLVVEAEAAGEGLCFSVTTTADRPDGLLYHLPERVQHLGLNLSQAPGTYIVRRVIIREIGKLQVLFRILRNAVSQLVFEPGRVRSRVRRGFEVWKQGGPRNVLAGILRADVTRSFSYSEWVSRYGTLTAWDRELILSRIDGFAKRPLISVLMPVHDPPEPFLRSAIESVLKQLYPDWELCVVDDASRNPNVVEILREYAERDPRVRMLRRPVNGGIVSASNAALELARGEMIALLDHDDELSEHALYMVVEELQSHFDAVLVYSDEDKIDEHGNRFDPWFKSDWNPDLHLSQNSVVHLGVYRTSAVREMGGFREGLDGSQDYDLSLRIVERHSPDRIRHIPHVLYHWRAIRGSTALHPAEKTYAYDSGKRALEDHIRARSIGARVSATGHPGYYRLTYTLPPEPPLVSIIVPTRDRVDLLRACVSGILSHTDYPNLELVIVNNRSELSETKRYFQKICEDSRVRVLDYDKPFEFSALNNWAVPRTSGSLIAFVNNDVEVINQEWLAEMARHALRQEVGAVGAKLYYPDGSIQHAGIVVGIGGLAGHAHQRLPRRTRGYFGRAVLVQNFSAVTAACMVLRREVFLEVSGFDAETFRVAFNDVDLCLRIVERGYRVVWTPFAELYHRESATLGLPTEPHRRAQFEIESKALRERWKKFIEHDPAYNPNLTVFGGDFSPAFPPRAPRPWIDTQRNRANGDEEEQLLTRTRHLAG